MFTLSLLKFVNFLGQEETQNQLGICHEISNCGARHLRNLSKNFSLKVPTNSSLEINSASAYPRSPAPKKDRFRCGEWYPIADRYHVITRIRFPHSASHGVISPNSILPNQSFLPIASLRHLLFCAAYISHFPLLSDLRHC